CMQPLEFPPFTF
nr:immunoglobulin light chain junction region [Macaca mulatta]MOY01891.1 immunoglobulin light chain junction region [Macaca mulatta]MOY02544.1 immunoglobulin light chain junction region [Macaca mulatta]